LDAYRSPFFFVDVNSDLSSFLSSPSFHNAGFENEEGFPALPFFLRICRCGDRFPPPSTTKTLSPRLPFSLRRGRVRRDSDCLFETPALSAIELSLSRREVPPIVIYDPPPLQRHFEEFFLSHPHFPPSHRGRCTFFFVLGPPGSLRFYHFYMRCPPPRFLSNATTSYSYFPQKDPLPSLVCSKLFL